MQVPVAILTELDLKQITPQFLNQRQFPLSCKFMGYSTDSISSTEKEGGSNDTSSHSRQEKNKSDSKDFDSPQVPDRRPDTEKPKTTITTTTTTAAGQKEEEMVLLDPVSQVTYNLKRDGKTRYFICTTSLILSRYNHDREV